MTGLQIINEALETTTNDPSELNRLYARLSQLGDVVTSPLAIQGLEKATEHIEDLLEQAGAGGWSGRESEKVD